MGIKIKRHQTLLYYDGVQIFEALDPIGGHYLCLLTQSKDAADQYLVVGVSPEKIRQFRCGELDLRDLILHRDLETWFLMESENDFQSDLLLTPQSGSQVPNDFLPQSGFKLHLGSGVTDKIVHEAQAKNNAVIEVSLDPPEAAYEPRVRALTLGACLVHVQTLVKHAYSKSLSAMSQISRKGVDATDAHLLDAYAQAPGSFKVFLQSARGPDLFGQVELQRSLEKLDELTQNIDDPQKAVEVLRKNKGHLAGAYVRLLQFLLDNKTSFTYEWAMPSFQKPRGRRITEQQARPLVDEFSKTAELTVETVTITGYLRRANSVSGAWGLESVEDGNIYAGSIKEGAVSLSNLVIDKIYRFHCEEQIGEVTGTGKEIRNLYLVRYEDA